MNLAFAPVPCVCGTQSTRPVLTRDRYLLPVHIAVCDACGLVHSARNVPGTALAEFYKTRYRYYYENIRGMQDAERMREQHQRYARARLQAIYDVVPRITSVLEIGSGLGCFLEACRDSGVPALLGFEPGEVFRRYASQMLGLGDAVRGEDYAQADRLPFAPQLVVLFHVFEHLADPAGFLRWAARHMQADGTLVIEVPDISGDWRRLGLFQFHLAHRWYFSPVTLANLLAQHGFEPYFISRSDRDEIYPGNLRIFARRGDAGAIYPLPVASAESQEKQIRAWVRPLSLSTGMPRAVWRRCRQALTRRTGIRRG